jgi:hypothetical protein
MMLDDDGHPVADKIICGIFEGSMYFLIAKHEVHFSHVSTEVGTSGQSNL